MTPLDERRGTGDNSQPAKPRRKASKSPTQRALAELRKRGWPAAITEHWNPHAMIRQDLFGVFDLLAIRPVYNAGEELAYAALDMQLVVPTNTPAILGIQVTTADNRSKRRDKLHAWPHLQAWLDTGARVELWTYSKMGKRGEKKLWTLNVEEIKPGGCTT